LGGGPYELQPVITSLEAEGITVSAPILPGHDGPTPVMPPSRWQDWAATADSAFNALSATGRPVSVVGFSTGATLALELATRKPVSRQVLLAPFLAIRFTRVIPLHPAKVIRPLARILPNLMRRAPAVRDPEMRKWASKSDRFRTFNLLATLSALELIDHVKPLVPAITVATLIIQGKLDTVVEPAGASWLYRNLGSADKTIVTLPRSDHLVALDRDREQVIDMTKAFILTTEK
jgi:carboxylesterase